MIKIGVVSSWVILLAASLALFSSKTLEKDANDNKDRQVPSGANRVSEFKMWRLYDSDPNHTWNRLYRSLYLRLGHGGREYGYDELDPLLWPGTKYLLNSSAYQEATSSLNQFLSSRAENLICDPTKRAILQRDLWAIFVWTTQVTNDSPKKLMLQKKLVEVMKRLALSPAQIESLPNNYQTAIASRSFAPNYDINRPEQPFLPPDLFDPSGPWVRLSLQGGAPVASNHVHGFSGRSFFLVLMRMPGGREATLKYLKNISMFPAPWMPVDSCRFVPNPRLPQFPVGTQLALIRQMFLIDEKGIYTPTSITEQVQIRVHRIIPREIPEGLNTDNNPARAALDVYEFKLSRPKFFADEDGGLRTVEAGETEFPLFQSHGIDLFEEIADQRPFERSLRVVVNSCSSCHFRPGIHSVLSREHGNVIPSWELNHEAKSTKQWKHGQFSWGLMQGLWHSQSSR